MNEADTCRALVVPKLQAAGWECARIEEELLKEFNLHTIVRLPNGGFAPYTGIPTNLLFFDRSGPTPAAGLLAGNCNLDRKNPRAKEDIAHLPPEQIAASILEKEQRIAEIMGHIQKLLAGGGS